MATRKPAKESPFVVRLRDIPPEGTQQVIDLTDEWGVQTLAGELLEWIPSRLRAEIGLHRAEREVIAHGRLTGGLETACSRCTSPTRLQIHGNFDLVFVPQDAEAIAAGPGERELAAGEAETVHYSDEQIDLEPVLREQLILALPYAPLCREDCAGLCPRCGNDLNELPNGGPCSCPAEAPEPEVKPDRWAALRDIKL